MSVFLNNQFALDGQPFSDEIARACAEFSPVIASDNAASAASRASLPDDDLLTFEPSAEAVAETLPDLPAVDASPSLNLADAALAFLRGDALASALAQKQAANALAASAYAD